jgi:ribosomal-protein-alanine N-acetyltransferase
MSVPPLRTARLRLEPLDPDRDAADLAGLWADPRFSEFELSPPPADLDQVRQRFSWVGAMPPGLGGWTLRWPPRPGLVGRVSLRTWVHDLDGPPELGWHLKPEYWGRGLASEAIRAVLRYGWGELGLGPVIALVHVDNQRSLAVVRRLGGRPTDVGQWYGPGHDFIRFEIDRALGAT